MPNGEKFKEIFSIPQVDDCDLIVYAWLPNHDAIEIPPEWWNAEYKEPKTGYWIEERTYMECPDCHEIWHYEENQTERFKCCPNCGAKMQEVKYDT